MHLQLPRYLHTLHLMRWYGLYQNGGHYNSDGLLAIFGRIRRLQDAQSELQARAAEWYPSVDTLRKTKAREMSKRGGTGAPAGLDPAPVDPLLQMLEPDSASLASWAPASRTQQKVCLLLLSHKRKKRWTDCCEDGQRCDLVAEELRHDGPRLDEGAIATMFAEHNLALEPLDPHLPPAYTPDAGAGGKGGSILNLVYAALALRKIREKRAQASTGTLPQEGS